VVICSELPSNEGSSITYVPEQIGAEVIRYHKLSAPVWIEHYPKEATDDASETFELVVFSSYEVKERMPYLGRGNSPQGSLPRSPSTATSSRR
jgi:hypothetical protein